MYSINEFIDALNKPKNTATVFNQYRASKVRENLRLYLNAMCKIKGKRVLLVGEAPGYKGCKLTGIPFTSGAVFQRFDHPLLQQLKNKLSLSDNSSENTATIVWEYLSTSSLPVPLFWNSFPFHPHPVNNDLKNRAPTADEIETGLYFLKKLSILFKPEIIAGIGNKGAYCASQAFPDKKVRSIRHPSFGGKAEFINGMNLIINSDQS